MYNKLFILCLSIISMQKPLIFMLILYANLSEQNFFMFCISSWWISWGTLHSTLLFYVYYRQQIVGCPVPISCFISFHQIEELYVAHCAWMVSSRHCKGRGALSVSLSLSHALSLPYFWSGNVVCRLSYVVCCRQQQLTAFRRVWPLADWREISKISIHKNSQECAHSHVLGMYS